MTSTNPYIAIILFLLVTHVLKFHRVVISLPETTSTLPTRDSVRGSSGQHNYKPGSSSLADSREIFLKDDLRVRSINKRHAFHQHSTNGETGYTPNDDDVLSVGAGIFNIEVAFGTPKRTFKLLLDTGSSITWLKCKQCIGGCKTEDKQLFYPSRSYSNRPCFNKEGDKNIIYNDRSSVVDLAYGCDTIFLDPFVIEEFTFGCGQVKGTGFEEVDGLLGLGQGDLSFMSQLPSQLSDVFTYCFQPEKNTLGHLAIGEEAKTKARNPSLMYTPLQIKEGSYQITLTGISVGAEKLDIQPSVFKLPGTILDSGTIITRLPEKAYTQLQQTFNRSMSKYNRSTEKDSLLDTCYDLNGVMNLNEAIPEIVLHFEGGADVKLGRDGVVWKINDNMFCLAFAKTQETSDTTIIGNHQLLGFEVVHDLGGMRIGFGSNSC